MGYDVSRIQLTHILSLYWYIYDNNEVFNIQNVENQNNMINNNFVDFFFVYASLICLQVNSVYKYCICFMTHFISCKNYGYGIAKKDFV